MSDSSYSPINNRLNCFIFSLVAALLFIGSGAWAEPYLAVREGVKCATCHVNKTGGGKRTALFAMTAKNFIHYPDTALQRSSEEAMDQLKEVPGKLTEYVSLGANLRFANVSIYRDEPKADGTVDKGQFSRKLQSNDFQVEEGLVYLQADLQPSLVTLYYEMAVAPSNAPDREAFGMVHGASLPGNLFFKAGRIFPDFGLRIENDESFIRSVTGFNFDNVGEGIELGLLPGKAHLTVGYYNDDANKGDDIKHLRTINANYLFTGLPVVRNLLVGAAAARNSSQEKTTFGAYLGFALGPFTLLAEGDLIKAESDDGGTTRSRAAYVELNYLPVDWLNLKVTGGHHDPDRDKSEDQQGQISFGFEAFVAQYMQLRTFYQIGNDIPQRPSGNVNTLTAEVHFFF